MNLSKTTFGNFELYTIETGDIKLDGGAMFGVVPKTLWSRAIEPDEKNRIPMTMRCLLVKSTKTGRVYLIDNGTGTKFNEKMTSIYQIDHSKKNLESSLDMQGFTFNDITDIVFTHLHFDHCGGTTYVDDSGELAHAFPNATYHIHRAHWQTAIEPNARETASFLSENIEPLKASDRVNLIDNDHEYEPGFSIFVANGHTKGQQLPILQAGDKTLVFMADLLPTHHHLPLPWVMGYDMYPTQTLLEKVEFFDQAADNNWYLYLEHDLDQEIVQVSKENGKYVVINFLTLNEL